MEYLLMYVRGQFGGGFQGVYLPNHHPGPLSFILKLTLNLKLLFNFLSYNSIFKKFLNLLFILKLLF